MCSLYNSSIRKNSWNVSFNGCHSPVYNLHANLLNNTTTRMYEKAHNPEAGC